MHSSSAGPGLLSAAPPMIRRARPPRKRSAAQRRAGAALLVVAVGILGGLTVLRVADDRSVQALWRDLEMAPSGGEIFSPEIVANLPDPAQRYFLHAIRSGTPLAGAAHLSQTGSIRLGSDWSPLSANQLLTPRGFVWKADSKVGPVPITATDYYASEHGRMRVAAVGLIPFINANGSDLTRSAIGRLVVEYMWLPSALLAQAGASIEAVDEERFSATVPVGGEVVHLVLRVESDGRSVESTSDRFGNQTPDGHYQYIPFGGRMDAEATFDGYTQSQAQSAWAGGMEPNNTRRSSASRSLRRCTPSYPRGEPRPLRTWAA